ncbi:MAG: hypothetical protein EBU66_16185 [Bacteroidetes bacterium]|nr:hypothetical protein [Bacteroidota bacterium]
MSRPAPQTSVGRLVSLTVDNPRYYTHTSSTAETGVSSSPPHLVPISYANSTNETNTSSSSDAEEKTMLWRNIANLFSKYENIEVAVRENNETSTRITNELYQEMKELQSQLEELHTNVVENNMLSKHVRKIRKYVNKKCEKLKEDISYGSSSADHEIFDYIETFKNEVVTQMKSIQDENATRKDEIVELNDIYYRDYEMFVKREDELMAKLENAVKMNETLTKRLQYLEDTMMRQFNNQNQSIHTMRNEMLERMSQRDFRLIGDMRQEFARTISKELEVESNNNAKNLQQTTDELTQLITSSNEYHSYRYFGMVEEMKKYLENSETLKRSIGMVDAELSLVKEQLEEVTEDVRKNKRNVFYVNEDLAELKETTYNELDRDYYDLKDYVKRLMRRHNHNYHHPCQVTEKGTIQQDDAVQLIVDEYAEQVETQATAQVAQEPALEDDEHLIIIDENTFRIDGDHDDNDNRKKMVAPQV